MSDSRPGPWRLVQDSLRLMVGVGSYAAYLEHMQKTHPGETPMTEAAYFRYCQETRYGGRAGVRRCPC